MNTGHILLSEEFEHERLLTPIELAKILHISRSSAYRLLQTKTVPCVRFNGSVRIRACDLQEFIRRSWSGWKQE